MSLDMGSTLDLLYQSLLMPWTYDFMQSAVLASVSLSIVCSLIGSFVVTRGLSLMGDGLSHASMGGIGIGLLAGVGVNQAVWFAIPTAAIVSLLTVKLSQSNKLRQDASLAVLFATLLAVGMIAFHWLSKTGRPVDVESLLFGNVLGIETSDLWLLGGLVFVVVSCFLFWGRSWALMTFYPEIGQIHGHSQKRLELGFMLLTSTVTVIAVKTVGILLVSAWLVIPAATGRLLAKRFGGLVGWALAVSVLGSMIGLLVSFNLDLPSGATMTLALSGLFGLATLVRR
jgi:ABC-type Mn2+/Zn2+ transport system permease subunit